MDRERSIERFLPLRPVEFNILLSLAGGERHGYGIILDAEARGLGDAPDVGTLYRALRRLEDQKLIGASGRRVAAAEARRMLALTRAARASGLLEVSPS